jgi:hypothetical protein
MDVSKLGSPDSPPTPARLSRQIVTKPSPLDYQPRRGKTTGIVSLHSNFIQVALFAFAVPSTTTV